MISLIKEKKLSKHTWTKVKNLLPPPFKSWKAVINHIILESWVKFH